MPLSRYVHRLLITHPGLLRRADVDELVRIRAQLNAVMKHVEAAARQPPAAPQPPAAQPSSAQPYVYRWRPPWERANDQE